MTNKVQYILLMLLFINCGEQDSQDESLIAISDTQFTFHQNTNQLFISAKVQPSIDNQILDRVMIEWFGTSLDNVPDNLLLFDDGTNGDIISSDDFYTLKIENDSLYLQNILGDDSGSVHINFFAMYVGKTEEYQSSFKIGNIIPRITNIEADTLITRPLGATLSLHIVSAAVFDADGLDNIKWVGFTSYHLEGDSMMNNGNYIYLYDDGSTNIIYLPDITSGDLVSGDGRFSFKIPVFGSGNTDPSYQTKTGTFRWDFIAQDKNDDYSLIKSHEVVIQ